MNPVLLDYMWDQYNKYNKCSSCNWFETITTLTWRHSNGVHCREFQRNFQRAMIMLARVCVNARVLCIYTLFPAWWVEVQQVGSWRVCVWYPWNKSLQTAVRGCISIVVHVFYGNFTTGVCIQNKCIIHRRNRGPESDNNSLITTWYCI